MMRRVTLHSSFTRMCATKARWLIVNVGVMECYSELVVWKLAYFGLNSDSLSGFFGPWVVLEWWRKWHCRFLHHERSAKASSLFFSAWILSSASRLKEICMVRSSVLVCIPLLLDIFFHECFMCLGWCLGLLSAGNILVTLLSWFYCGILKRIIGWAKICLGGCREVWWSLIWLLIGLGLALECLCFGFNSFGMHLCS